jgi:hypothetical protein
MNIGLIDVDGHNFPNLALMKISAYHKAKGDRVEWWNGFLHYDRVYKCKVFDSTYSEDMPFCINADEVLRGGTGYDLKSVLPDEIEHQYPDYGLYRIHDKAFGFLTRGCPRGCPFCIVKEKEGTTHTVADLDEFWRGEKQIVLMDSNITASKDCERLFEQLIKSKAKINFEGGLDIRLLTDKGVSQINRMNIDMVHFAWDNYEFKTYEILAKYRPKFETSGRNLRVYVLTNFNTTHAQDLERVMKLRELDYDPFVMVYDKPNAPKETRRLQRWCNNKFIYRSCNFEDYKA